MASKLGQIEVERRHTGPVRTLPDLEVHVPTRSESIDCATTWDVKSSRDMISARIVFDAISIDTAVRVKQMRVKAGMMWLKYVLIVMGTRGSYHLLCLPLESYGASSFLVYVEFHPCSSGFTQCFAAHKVRVLNF